MLEGGQAHVSSSHGAELPRLLPPASSLSPSLRSFLDHEFKSADDLSCAPSLVARLSSELQSCELGLSQLQTRILEKVAIWASHSQSLSSSLNALSQGITDFTARAERSVVALGEPALDSDVKNGTSPRWRFSALEKDALVGQLPALVGEVARVERVRVYAETALRLEAFVGDLEDAVATIVKSTPSIKLPRKLAHSPIRDVTAGSSLKLANAIHTLQEIESELFHTIRSWPQWKRLFSAVDLRVDVAVASLRPSAVADYRSKLATIGWPPPLSAGNLQEGGYSDKELKNPLLGMHGDTKLWYEESFVALSTLQAVQCRRRARQLAQVSDARLINDFRLAQFRDHELLWTVDELVAPIGSRAEYHFLKWSEKPDLIFGLAYRIAQQYVESLDMILQPMLDKVRLAGYIVREEWVSALVLMVVKHLRSNALPQLARQLSEELRAQESFLWLHMVDLAITFDKRMQRVAFQSVGPLTGKMDLDSLQESEFDSQPLVKCIDVFGERREWLELWAHLELLDIQEKLSMELQKESAWLQDGMSDLPIGTLSLETSEMSFAHENYRAPQGAKVSMLKMWSLISRCRTLTQSEWQLSFIRLVGAPFMKGYLETLLQRCQEAEALTALAGEGAVLKVAVCINGAYFCEQKLQEWSEDVFFLNLRLQQILSADGELESKDLGRLEVEVNKEEKLSSVKGSVFDEEMSSLVQFRAEWLQKLVSAVQRAFDGSFQEYQRNKKRWQDETNVTALALSNVEKADLSLPTLEDSQKSMNGGASMDIGVSPSLVDALAILQGRLNILNVSLGDVVFMEFWRSLASGLDQFYFNSIVLGGSRFSVYGSRQLVRDIKAIFQIFKPFCVRPASFFPNLSDAITLHSLPKGEAVALLKNISSASSWRFREPVEETRSTSLKESGVRWINPGIAGKVLSHQILPKI